MTRLTLLLCAVLIAWLWAVAPAQEQPRTEAIKHLEAALCTPTCPEWVRVYIEKQKAKEVEQ